MPRSWSDPQRVNPGTPAAAPRRNPSCSLVGAAELLANGGRLRAAARGGVEGTGGVQGSRGGGSQPAPTARGCGSAGCLGSGLHRTPSASGAEAEMAWPSHGVLNPSSVAWPRPHPRGEKWRPRVSPTSPSQRAGRALNPFAAPSRIVLPWGALVVLCLWWRQRGLSWGSNCTGSSLVFPSP